MDGLSQMLSNEELRASRRFILVKPSLISAHASHFAGGKHAFLCMASTLASLGHQVDVVCCSNKPSLIVSAMTGAPMAPRLQNMNSTSVTFNYTHNSAQYGHTDAVQQAGGDGAQQETIGGMSASDASGNVSVGVVQWQHEIAFNHELAGQLYSEQDRQEENNKQQTKQINNDKQGMACLHEHNQPCVHQAPGTSNQGAITFHAVLKDEVAVTGGSNSQGMGAGPLWQQAVTSIVTKLARNDVEGGGESPHEQRTIVIVDADDCQLSQQNTKSMHTDEPAAEIVVAANSSDSHQDESRQAEASTDNGTTNGAQLTIICASCRNSKPSNASTAYDCSRRCCSLFERLVSTGRSSNAKVLALVQNVHFLPCGPSGTSQRTAGLLQAWCRLHGVICVSKFVYDYVTQYLSQELAKLKEQQLQDSNGMPVDHLGHPNSNHSMHVCAPQMVTGSTPASMTQEQHTDSFNTTSTVVGLLPSMHVTHLNAWGCFGSGPFTDLTLSAIQQRRLWTTAELDLVSPNVSDQAQEDRRDHKHGDNEVEEHNSEVCNSYTPKNDTAVQSRKSPTSGQKLPVVAVLKLTPEKGCSIVHDMAIKLAGRCNFLIVAGDPAVKEVFEGMKHVKVIEPQKGVEGILKHACVVLAPSLWLEAWGMVVTEAMLHGIPVITSNTGALPEAGLGVCPVVAVQPIVVPCCSSCNTPCWQHRLYPRQQVDVWVQALSTVLNNESSYQDLALLCRQTALRFVADQPAELQTCLSWLMSL